MQGMPSTPEQVRAAVLNYLADTHPADGEGSVAALADEHRYVLCLREAAFTPDTEVADALRTIGLDPEPALGRQHRRCYGFTELEQALEFAAQDGWCKTALWDTHQSSLFRAIITPHGWL